MAVNIRPVVGITIDDPCLSGRIAEDGHHFGRNWEAIYDTTDPYSTDWEYNGCDYLDSMQAILPRKVIGWTDMALANWVIEDGAPYWYETRPAITIPRCEFLHYGRSESGYSGRIRSVNTYRPGIYVRMLHFVPVDGETAIPYTVVDLFGTVGESKYALLLPFGDTSTANTQYVLPRIYRYSLAEPIDLDHPLAEMPDRGTSVTTGSNVLIQDVMIEQLDNYLRVLISGYDKDWIVENGDAPLTSGCVQLSFGAHAAMFNVQPIQWPTPAVAMPTSRKTIPSWNTCASEYAFVGYEPAGTDITITEDADAGDAHTVRPVITFIGTTGVLRPLVYRVQQATEPTVYTAESDPTSVSSKRTTWHRDNTWRNSWFDVEYNDFESAIELPPNAQTTFAISWDTGGAAPEPATRIIGFLSGSSRDYTGDHFGKAVPHMRAKDHPTAKLKELKYMRQMPSFEEWPACNLFSWLLNTVGVDDTYIDVDASITEIAYVLPRSSPPWDPGFEYPDDYGFVQAMDDIFVKYFDLQWGWNESGYFLRPRPAYGGTPDWILNYDTTDTTAIVSRLNVEQAFDEMRNYVLIQSPDGGAADRDLPSHVDPTADNFVGDDRWNMGGGAEDATAAATMAAERLARLSEFSLVITIECERLDLEPDMFIQIDSHPDPDIPNDSVFRIVDEDGASEGMDCKVIYTCVIEEYGS